jgi:pimeloyl-ACP methyl ester carboxylesterase
MSGSHPVKRHRGRAKRVVAGIGITLLVLLLGTYLIPVGTSGTKNYRDAAPRGTQFVEISGVDIAYRFFPAGDISDNNRLFVLLHGFGASSFSWRDVVEDLSNRGDVVTYDRPGFGFSERPKEWEGDNPYGSEAQCEVLAYLVERFGAEAREVVLVGHSAGGTLALDCVLRDSTVSTHLVLIAPAALSGGGPPGIGLVGWIPPLDRLGPLLVREISESGNALLFESVVDQSILTESVLAGYRAPLDVSGWERGLWEFTLAPRANITEADLARVGLPTLVVTGDSDAIVSRDDSFRIAQAIPDSTFVEVDRVGHLPQEEDPGRTIAEIDRFLGITP